jgi:hypothetical protein
MRTALAVMVVLALLAGCTGDPGTPPASEPTGAAGPTGLTAVAGQAGENGTAAPLPAEFLAGFRVDDVHLGVQGAEPNVGVTSSGAIFATAFETTAA